MRLKLASPTDVDVSTANTMSALIEEHPVTGLGFVGIGGADIEMKMYID